MDFSKWKKIAIILIIISLCLSIFSKVFGAYSDSLTTVVMSDTSYELDIDYLTSQYSYYSLLYRYSNGSANLTLVCSNSEMNVNITNQTRIYPTNNDSVIAFTVGRNTLDNCVNSWNNTYFDVSLGNHTYQNSSYNIIRQSLFTSSFSYNPIQDIVLSNFDVKNTSGEVIFENNVSYNYPHFDNVSEIESGYPDSVFISRGDYSENINLYFHLLKITYTVPDGNDTVYYYSDKVFELNKNCKYYRTWDADENNNYSYYSIPRFELGLDTNSSYLYVLTNSSDSFNNSYGILQPDYPANVYDVVLSDTTGVITSQDSTNDKIDSTNDKIDSTNDKLQNIDNTLNDNTVSSDTETDIDDSLNFDNENSSLNDMNGGFFSRLTTMLSNLLGYDLGDDTVIRIPYPNSQNYLELHSNILYNNVSGPLLLIINAFWLYIFAFYMYKFINKLYIAISTGNILDTFSSSGEAITNNML